MALKWLRDNLKHLKWVLWFVVIVFVLLVFVDWGTGRSGGVREGVAVQVGDYAVSEQEFLHELRDAERRYQSLYGEQWEKVRNQINLAQQTAQQIVQRQLLIDVARRAGLRVSDRELQEQIMSVPSFQRQGGAFVGRELYERILRANQTTPDEFEQQMRGDLLIDKLRRTLEAGVVVSNGEVDREIRQQRETADFDMIRFSVDPFLSKASASNEAVQQYYNQHKQDFHHPEQRVLRYLLVDSNALRRLLPVDESEVAKYYQQHQDEFREGEQAKASHILIRVDPGASAEERARAKVKAEAIAKMARSGTDFATLARKHSEDPGSKDKGGELGWFGRGQMVKVFEDAVFGAKPGQIVGPIESQFGYHIVKVEGFKAAHQKPLDEVKDEVRFKLLETRAAAEAEKRAHALEQRLRSAPPKDDAAWQKIADEGEAVSLNVTPPFAKGEVIPGIGENAELNKAVFAAKVGDLGDPIPTSRGWVIWQLKDIKAAGVPPLDAVKDKVAAKVVRLQAVNLARAAAEAAAASWAKGGNAESVAKEVGGTLVPVHGHRHGAPLPGLGAAPTLDTAVFASNDGAVLPPEVVGEQNVVIAKVLKVTRLTDDEMAAARKATRKQLIGTRVNDLLTSILSERRRETVVSINSELMNRFAPKGQGGQGG